MVDSLFLLFIKIFVMLLDFNSLPDNSKIWIYQSNRKFYPQELDAIKNKIESFLNQWTNDNKTIQASYEIKYDRFILFAVDAANSPLSLNAIDQSVSFIIEIQEIYSVELLDKLNVCFKQGEHVQYKDLKTFQKLVKNKSVSSKTIVFNNLINTKEELENNWEIPITESWHSRFIK
tara:strand:- start:39 stop:566 length:528 start_codon:yes stop_codon:yes gene_type:complete